MPRYLIVKESKIRVISDHEIKSDDEVIIFEDDKISNQELMLNYTCVDGHLVRNIRHKLAKDTKVAFVGNWKMKCGISTYSEKLWPLVANQIKDWKIFAEFNSTPTSDMNLVGDDIVENTKIVECWKRGQQLNELIQEIVLYNPDVVWIQHEYGLWPDARHWLSFISRLQSLGTRVIVTLHSVYKHMDKLVNEAIIPEIIVHLNGARSVLKDIKGVPGQVYVMPHGCDAYQDKTRLWNIYRSEKTFMQFGFGFRYKGWENSIRAVAELKKTHKDVFFTGLFSESSFCMVEHQTYYDDLVRLIKELNVEENVALIRGFQSNKSLDSFLQTNKAIVFPYVSHPDHEVFGVSGAARYAMSKNIPIVTTSVNHFSDVPTIKADTPIEIANELEKLLLDNDVWKKQVSKQENYAVENSWENVAKIFINILENNFKQ